MLRALRRGRVQDADARASVGTLLALPVTLCASADLVPRAFDIALSLDQRIYDCFYAALAEALGAEFWTADERLYNALSHHLPFVRFIADYTARRPA